MTATACCTSKPIIYQIQLIPTRPQYPSILPLTTLSPSSSTSIISTPEIHPSIKLHKRIQNDINNNNDDNDDDDQFEHLISDINNQRNADLTNDNNNNDRTDNYIDDERLLGFVGLRHKTKKKPIPTAVIRPLAKRLATPICLLPLSKHAERVRQALYILLPFLKFLSFTHDIEFYCSTDADAIAESLFLRSVTQTRTSKTNNKKSNQRKVSKTEFITMAANTFRNNNRRTPMAKYINSTLQCNVVLDRLDQSTIDQIMKNSTEDNQTQLSTTSKTKRPLRNNSFAREKSPLYRSHCLSNEITTKTTTTRTTITTMTTEKTTVKHQSTTTTTASPSNESKRFKKSSDNDCLVISDMKDKPSLSASSLTYKRICLKCFICSKREYIDAQATNSDILHSHWLEHGHDLSLNIYDSEIDSILTRVVEFFHFPRRHQFEGKIQTVYILNSKEIRKTSSAPLDDENCIVID